MAADDPPDDPIDVVFSVGDLDATVVALRDFLHKSGAVEVQAVVERPDGPPALITCGRLQPIEVVEGDRTVHLPHAVELDATPPDLEQIPPLPPVEVDAEQGVITGPLGGVEAMARITVALAEHLGGQSVALAFFATTNADVPLGIGARPGDEPVVTLGEQQFTLP
jgi:hypothetical protein